MASQGPSPSLSIVVPTLEEIETLPGLLSGLASQRDVGFELIVCDGGSSDGSRAWLSRQGAASPFPVTLLETSAGRARQMNAGAAAASADHLLFLHADSTFSDPLALSRGLSALRAAAAGSGHHRVAGHFALRFDLEERERTAAYHFFEAKARSGRPDTIHGDQGFLLPAELFREVGPFDENLGIFEDDRFADRVRQVGRWELLPAEIRTSARRFRAEGLLARQVLNALLVNFAAIGWTEFFARAPEIYRRQDRSEPLDLTPFFNLVEELLGRLPKGERRRLWRRTGRFVRSQGWQLGLALDSRRNFLAGLEPGAGPTPWLNRFDRWYDRLTRNLPGELACGLLVRTWFLATRHRLIRRSRHTRLGRSL